MMRFQRLAVFSLALLSSACLEPEYSSVSPQAAADSGAAPGTSEGGAPSDAESPTEHGDGRGEGGGSVDPADGELPPPNSIPLPRGRQVTACFYGASTGNPDDSDYGQNVIDRLCASLPGTVRYEAGEIRGLVLNLFSTERPRTQEAHVALPFDNSLDLAVEKILTAADTNADGTADGRDEPSEINLVGYSWGGFNAAEVADRLGQRAPQLRVRRLVLLDPYKVVPAGIWASPAEVVEIPNNVDYALTFRHSLAGACDKGCGRGMASFLEYGPLGIFKKAAYTGRRPRLRSGSTVKGCYATDINRLHSDSAPYFGHCEAPYVAEAAVRQLFGFMSYGGQYRALDPSSQSCTNYGGYTVGDSNGGSIAAPLMSGGAVAVSSLNDFADGQEDCLQE